MNVRKIRRKDSKVVRASKISKKSKVLKKNECPPPQIGGHIKEKEYEKLQ